MRRSRQSRSGMRQDLDGRWAMVGNGGRYGNDNRRSRRIARAIRKRLARREADEESR